jgi:2'-5' RNA ligase
VPPERLHLTLHYLGELRHDAVAALCECLPPIPASFELAFGQPALWPHGIAVLEPLEVPPELLALHAALVRALHAVGLRTDERPFRPHVTLARHAQSASLPAEGARWSWPVNGYALVHSVREPPLRYEVLRRIAD